MKFIVYINTNLLYVLHKKSGMGWTLLQIGYIKNAKVNLRRKNIWQSTSREPKERWIAAMTRDARKLLGTVR